jgi:hypothetical protein
MKKTRGRKSRVRVPLTFLFLGLSQQGMLNNKGILRFLILFVLLPELWSDYDKNNCFIMRLIYFYQLHLHFVF